MSNPRLTALRGEFDKVRAGIEAIETKAVAESRDLSDPEQADSDALYTRAEQLKPEIDKLAQREHSLAATADVLSRVTPHEVSAPARTEPRKPNMTPGEYVGNLTRALMTHDQDAVETLVRTVANVTTTQDAGVVPEFITGDLVKFVDDTRRAVNACRMLPMPAKGKKFERPRLSQRASVANQVNEYDELSSTQLLVTSDEITKKTYGGVLDITEQNIDWTDPSLMQIVIEDLAGLYATATETVTTTAIAAAVTEGTETIVSLTATSAVFLAALATGAAQIYTDSKGLPDTLFVAPDRWAYLAALTDTTGRPVFPTAGAYNAAGGPMANLNQFGGSPLGLNVVVSPSFAANTWILANTKFCEVFEQNKGLLSIVQPSTLSVRVAYRGYFATNIYSQGLNGLEAA